MEKYIQPFIDVCETVFHDMLDCELKAERPFFSDKNDPHNWDISAVIGLTGEARGAVVISMKLSLALKLTGILTGTAHFEPDEEVVDAVGELVNIIAGNAKRGLEGAFHLVISLPTIVSGKKHSILWPSDQTRIICIPFKVFEADTFCLSVAIESAKGA